MTLKDGLGVSLGLFASVDGCLGEVDLNQVSMGSFGLLGTVNSVQAPLCWVESRRQFAVAVHTYGRVHVSWRLLLDGLAPVESRY